MKKIFYTKESDFCITLLVQKLWNNVTKPITSLKAETKGMLNDYFILVKIRNLPYTARCHEIFRYKIFEIFPRIPWHHPHVWVSSMAIREDCALYKVLSSWRTSAIATPATRRLVPTPPPYTCGGALGLDPLDMLSETRDLRDSQSFMYFCLN
jgi:hypothetical protein